MLTLNRPEIQHGVHVTVPHQGVAIRVEVEFIGEVHPQQNWLVVEAKEFIQLFAVGRKALRRAGFTHANFVST